MQNMSDFFEMEEEEKAEEMYNPTLLSPQQIQAGNEIVHCFMEDPSGIRWAVLLAQMQSGKTETFLFVCSELIRLLVVKSAVIFSGNAETDLREQLKKEVYGKEDAKFYGKYMCYLNSVGVGFNEIVETIAKIKSNISVLWGTELKKIKRSYKNTLFVWEEAHHAQSIDQCPDVFLKKVGISADGNSENLSKNGNYVVSVSATPFSEISDKHHFEQSKKIVYMQPGVGYNSVKTISESGRLKPFKCVEDGLRTALETPHSSPKYALVRITKKNERVVRGIIGNSNWSAVTYDSVSDEEEMIYGQRVWNHMKTAPSYDTVILLRGKCRMGKNLEKEHLLFVMETCKSSNTDTILQGLLGRVCGYSSNHNIDVYLHEKIIKGDEIKRYIELTEGMKVIPTKAKNLDPAKKEHHLPIVPIKIRRSNQSNARKDILTDVYNALNAQPDRVSNKNVDPVYREVVKIYNASYESDQKNIKRHNLNTTSKTANDKTARKLRNAFEEKKRTHLGCGKGHASDGNEVSIWVPTDIQNFDLNTIYITAYVMETFYGEDVDINSLKNIQSTTGKEVFSHGLEDETEIVGNGGFTIPLSTETYRNQELMFQELCAMIDITLNHPNNIPRIVSSCYDIHSKEYKGIIVTHEMFASFQKDGDLYKKIFDKYKLSLTLKKPQGAIPKYVKEMNCIKLASISWKN